MINDVNKMNGPSHNKTTLRNSLTIKDSDQPVHSSSGQHSFVEIDHEIFSTVIFSLPLIQDGQLSVSGERMCTILVNRLED